MLASQLLLLHVPCGPAMLTQPPAAAADRLQGALHTTQATTTRGYVTRFESSTLRHNNTNLKQGC
jgi:hypothetical protein